MKGLQLDDTKIAVIIVHGLGTQKKSYADKFMKKLRETFSRTSGIPHEQLAMEAVHWADVLRHARKN